MDEDLAKAAVNEKNGRCGNSELPPTYIEGYHDLDAVKQMKYRNLGNTNMIVSQLSYGVSAVGSVFRETDDQESYRVIEHLVKSGVNWIDAAPWYGQGKGESVLGQALKEKKIPRQAFYLSTKVGRYSLDRDKMFDFSAEKVMQSVDESLSRMGVDYVDVIQVHDMEFAQSIDVIINETLPALQKIKEMGKARHIGITGYPLENFQTVIERSPVNIDTVMSYCRCCLNDTTLLTQAMSFLKSKGVGVVSASANAMGLLTDRPPPAWHPASPAQLEACRHAVDHCREQQCDISRLAIAFTASQPGVHTCMISTASMQNARKNVRAAVSPLTTREQECTDTIRDKLFGPLEDDQVHWGWTDVTKHWAKIKELFVKTNGDEPCEELEALERRVKDPRTEWLKSLIK